HSRLSRLSGTTHRWIHGSRRMGRTAAKTQSTWGTGSCRAESSCQGQFYFLGTPGCVSKRSLNVILLEIWMRPKNFVDAMSRREQTEDGTHGNAHSSNARTSPHHRGIVRDALQEFHLKQYTR